MAIFGGGNRAVIPTFRTTLVSIGITTSITTCVSTGITTRICSWVIRLFLARSGIILEHRHLSTVGNLVDAAASVSV